MLLEMVMVLLLVLVLALGFILGQMWEQRNTRRIFSLASQLVALFAAGKVLDSVEEQLKSYNT